MSAWVRERARVRVFGLSARAHYRSYAPATIAQKCATAEVAKKAMMSEAKLICAAEGSSAWE